MNAARKAPCKTAFARMAALACGLAACVLTGGGHWTALQTVAWARMSVGYTLATGSLQQGLAQTFDGEHPCEMCRQIKAGLEKDRHDERQKPGKETEVGKIKLAVVLPAGVRAEFSPVTTRAIGFSSSLLGRLLDAPPTPPPRAA